MFTKDASLAKGGVSVELSIKRPSTKLAEFIFFNVAKFTCPRRSCQTRIDFGFALAVSAADIAGG